MLLSFKDLVSDREGTMRRICEWCGIAFDASVMEQTFDGNPIIPNTNFDGPIEGIAEAVLDRKQCLAECDRVSAYELTKAVRRELESAGWTG